MTNEIIQRFINEVKLEIDREIAVINADFVAIASTNKLKINCKDKDIDFSLFTTGEAVIKNGSTYIQIGSSKVFENCIRVEGIDKEALKYALILSSAIKLIIKNNSLSSKISAFIKEIILDNIVTGELEIELNQLKLKAVSKRVLYVITFEGEVLYNIYQELENLFPKSDKDFIICMGENEIVLVKEINYKYENVISLNLAKTIEKTIYDKCDTNVLIGISNMSENIKQLSTQYKEAKTAIEIEKTFEKSKNIASYNNLGLNRLINDISNETCENFLKEIIKTGYAVNNLENELLETMNMFFQTNLNISETSRRLFIHRNTLVYRLDKIKSKTGFDIRKFDQSVLIKLALMVDRKLNYNKLKD